MRLAVLVGLALGAGTPCRAARLEAGPFGGVLSPHPALGFGRDRAPMAGARLGLGLSPRWSLQARAGWAHLEAARSGSLRSVALGFLSAALQVDILRDARVRPFVTAGLGYSEDMSTDAPSAVADPFAELGGGLRLGGRTGPCLRLDAMRLFQAHRARSGRGVLQSTLVGARLEMPLSRPADADGDGVRDGRDRCKDTLPGARVDARGCPQDGDGDGVPDGLDACEATPVGARVDALGCSTDADADGVADGLDLCSATPAAAVVDRRGCPSDSDADGVLDGLDRCPETPSGRRVDASGCPLHDLEMELLDTGRLRLRGVRFLAGSSQLDPASTEALDAAGDLLARWPQLCVEIAGHTDARGDAERNRLLSERRAAAVAEYLRRRFPRIRSHRLRVHGYGESQPVASDATEAGRALNRRVELVVLNRDQLRQIR